MYDDDVVINVTRATLYFNPLLKHTFYEVSLCEIEELSGD